MAMAMEMSMAVAMKRSMATAMVNQGLAVDSVVSVVCVIKSIRWFQCSKLMT